MKFIFSESPISARRSLVPNTHELSIVVCVLISGISCWFAPTFIAMMLGVLATLVLGARGCKAHPVWGFAAGTALFLLSVLLLGLTWCLTGRWSRVVDGGVFGLAVGPWLTSIVQLSFRHGRTLTWVTPVVLVAFVGSFAIRSHELTQRTRSESAARNSSTESIRDSRPSPMPEPEPQKRRQPLPARQVVRYGNGGLVALRHSPSIDSRVPLSGIWLTTDTKVEFVAREALWCRVRIDGPGEHEEGWVLSRSLERALAPARDEGRPDMNLTQPGVEQSRQ